ncbi:hypothetical protein [Roseicyclus mahoneyensis]|uniref:Variant SH3 domain-containing protein n=1 Tax=Roseicyclus mahoneyensis TaxID=164332 RepID=A0A316GE73_9RHOB|nr:hypothetical protein [Roseicyclus mahoneyensis]PWK59299.1 hypothetical protein C7455_10867 [Roseicyclus mahoneyensis]
MARSTPERATLTQDWQASYTPALSVARGQRLASHHTDPDNPGWRWTTNAEGLGGWLPEGLVVDGCATADFDSTELTIAAGTPVVRLLRLNGWSLCETPQGTTGWLPDSHLMSL